MSKKDELLKAAEAKVRLGGYSNFSFRELASEVGIKSASVHYHFPTKADLGAELARQYTDNFLAALGEPDTLKAEGKEPIEEYINAFRHALIQDRKMCLCGLLGAESDCLPEKVRVETKRFFELNLAWLEKAHIVSNPATKTDPRRLAIKTVSLLEGAMMISKTLKNDELFDLAAALI